MPNYNRIAWIYSFLLKLVFGNRQYVANTEYIGEIPSDARVLVVGGGTGKIIECLDKLNKNLELDYVEISSSLLDRSKKRVHNRLKLKFHHQPILNFSLKGSVLYSTLNSTTSFNILLIYLVTLLSL